MRRLWWITIASISLIITSFSSNAIALDWIPMPANPGLTYLSESAIRVGDDIYLAAQGPTYRIQRDGSQVRDDTIHTTWLEEFDCATYGQRMLLLDRYQGGSFLRMFQDASRSYKQAVFKQFDDSSPGMTRLKTLCASLPLHQERLVNIGKGDGDTLFQIDTRSVRDIGQLKTVWARIDYPTITLNPPYGAPFDSIRELISLDCAAGKAQVPIRYYFSPTGGITDAIKLFDQPAPAISFTSDPFIEQVAHTVCGQTIDPENFSGSIGGDVIRPKPDTPTAPPIEAGAIPEGIRPAAEAFSRELPGTARFSTATITETSVNSSSEQNKINIVIKLKPQPDGTTLYRQSYGTAFYLDVASVGGFAPLTSRMINNTPEVRGVVTEQLSADISGFAEGATFTYRRTMRHLGAPTLSEDSQTCHVEKAIDAATLNAALTGRAWPVSCVAGDQTVQSGYYVEALRFFLVTKNGSNSFGDWVTHIDALSIEQ